MSLFLRPDLSQLFLGSCETECVRVPFFSGNIFGGGHILMDVIRLTDQFGLGG